MEDKVTIKKWIGEFKYLEQQIEYIREKINKLLEWEYDFEWIEEHDTLEHCEVKMEKEIDGVTYAIINRDDIDHESHYVLCIVKPPTL